MTTGDGPVWNIVFDRFDPADEKRREALLALGNGALLVRGATSLDGTAYAGTYRAGLYDRRDEVAAGQALRHDVLVNLPNWLPLTLRPAGAPEWLSPWSAGLLRYRHALDTRGGVSCRELLLDLGGGRRVRLCESRLVSMARPRLAALRLEVELIGWSGTLELRSALQGSDNANWPQEMPTGQRLTAPCRGSVEPGNTMLLRTALKRAGTAIAMACRTDLVGAEPQERRFEPDTDGIADILTFAAQAGQPVRVEKVVAICTARDPASFEPAEAALLTLRGAPGFEELLAEHRIAWERLWERCHLRAADPALERALRFHAFHLLQTACQHSIELDCGLPARGWQEAYAGHVFWDQTFAFPVLALRLPAVARGLLLYRFRRLGAARAAARAAGRAGAMFPWRSAASGREETPALQPNPLDGHWTPDQTRLAHHAGLALARDLHTYVLATGDLEFLALYGAEMMVEIARFWASMAEPAAGGRFDIAGVVGPDEYHTAGPDGGPGLRTDAYTNVMAAWVLARAPEMLDMLPRPRRDALCRALRLHPAELDHWDLLTRRLALCFGEDGILLQFCGYDQLCMFDAARAAAHPGTRTDLALEAEGERANDVQVAKQADVLMLFYLLPAGQLRAVLARLDYRMDDAQLARTARFYLDRTVHDSSLSRVSCAGAFATIDPAASWNLYNDALRLDLDPERGCGAAEGVHLGTMAATLDVLQRIFLGLRVVPEGLLLDPAMPAELPPVAMRLFHRGNAFDLEWTGTELRLQSDPANYGPVIVLHAGRRCTLSPGAVEAFPVRGATSMA